MKGHNILLFHGYIKHRERRICLYLWQCTKWESAIQGLLREWPFVSLHREFLQLSKTVPIGITENCAKSSRFEERISDPKHLAAYKQSSTLTKGKDIKIATCEWIFYFPEAKDHGERGVGDSLQGERFISVGLWNFSCCRTLPEMCADWGHFPLVGWEWLSVYWL